MDLVRDRTLVNIEIKASAYEAHQPADSIERQIVELVKRNNHRTSVLISSFEWKILENIVSMDNALHVALLSKYPADVDNVGLCERLKAFSWHPNCGELQYEHVKKMHGLGIWVFPYNVDSQDEYQRMIQMDVDGVITSDPITVPILGTVVRK